MPVAGGDESYWKQRLTPEQYAVLRQKATEAPGSSYLNNVYDAGRYMCAACGAVLFDSGTKFDTGCGWPSFYDAKPGSVVMTPDDSAGMDRTEVTCANCGGHLGHLFVGEGLDTPIDQRYCINGVALKFEKSDSID